MHSYRETLIARARYVFGDSAKIEIIEAVEHQAPDQGWAKVTVDGSQYTVVGRRCTGRRKECFNLYFLPEDNGASVKAGPIYGFDWGWRR